jgi:peptidoglycan/LPS O-acetylase OafA/YrhL
MLASFYNKFRRITTNHLYFPEIDGIRFVAIMLVLLFHIHGYFAAKAGFPATDTAAGLLNTFFINGDRGVELFFVLSGFILCLPFAHHYINHGKTVSLKRYYLRRVTRLEPPYFLAMSAIFLLHIITHTTSFAIMLPHWLASLAYVHNIVYHRASIVTVVAWSLEIEIQFYLMAPLLFRILSLHRAVRRIMLLAGIIAVILLQHTCTTPFLTIFNFGQYFLTGILLADLYVSNTASAFFNKKWIAPLAAIILATIIYLPIKSTISAPQLLAAHLVFPFLIGLFYYIVFKNQIIKRVFSYKFIPIIGGMCYSIYLLHYTIISVLGRFTTPFHITGGYLPNLFLQIILLMIPILLLSAVFYFYIERPFMSGKWLDLLLKKDKTEKEAIMQSEIE